MALSPSATFRPASMHCISISSIELIVELDNGPIYNFVVPVGQDGRVILTLPL